VVGILAFGLALALLIIHFVDRSVPITYAVAAFIMAAIVAAGDLREVVGEVCTVVNATRTCVYEHTVKFESLVALVASIAFAAMSLALFLLERLSRAVSDGWDV